MNSQLIERIFLLSELHYLKILQKKAVLKCKVKLNPYTGNVSTELNKCHFWKIM